ARLADRLEERAELLLQHYLESALVDDPVFPQGAGELLSHRIANLPALQRGDAILGGHGLAIVPGKPLAQLDRCDKAIAAQLPGVGHLWPDLEFFVHSEQRVVDEIAVIAHDVGAAP